MNSEQLTKYYMIVRNAIPNENIQARDALWRMREELENLQALAGMKDALQRMIGQAVVEAMSETKEDTL